MRLHYKRRFNWNFVPFYSNSGKVSTVSPNSFVWFLKMLRGFWASFPGWNCTFWNYLASSFRSGFWHEKQQKSWRTWIFHLFELASTSEAIQFHAFTANNVPSCWNFLDSPRVKTGADFYITRLPNGWKEENLIWITRQR